MASSVFVRLDGHQMNSRRLCSTKSVTCVHLL